VSTPDREGGMAGTAVKAVGSSVTPTERARHVR